MAKPANAQPDEKKIKKTAKSIKKLCDQLKAFGKEFKEVSAVAKELDKKSG